jgi:hypothetical protein
MEDNQILNKTRVHNYIPELKDSYKAMVDGQMIEVGILWIDAHLATSILKHHNKNRDLKKANLAFLKNQLVNGWIFDGEPIRFDENLDLIDGRHRMTVLSGLEDVKKPFLVVKNLKPDAFKVMDTGKKRSGGDVLSIEGIEESYLVAPAMKLANSIKNGSFAEARVASKGGLSNAQLVSTVHENEGIIEAVKDAKYWGKQATPRIMTDSTAAAFLYLFRESDEVKADEFMEKVITGYGLEKGGSPITALRTRLVNAQKNRISFLGTKMRNALTVIAWNKFKEDKTVSNLKVPKDLGKLKVL